MNSNLRASLLITFVAGGLGILIGRSTVSESESSEPVPPPAPVKAKSPDADVRPQVEVEPSGVLLKRPKKIKPPVPAEKSKSEGSAPVPVAEEAGEEDTGWVDPPLPRMVLPPGDPSWPAELENSIKDAQEDLQACADEWRQEVPNMQGRVMMGMLVGTEGLESTELIEFDDLPEALVGCISASLFEVAWPATEDGVVHVRYPFFFNSAEPKAE